MNQQNTPKMPSSSAPEVLPVKRKRGRPRKDESISRIEKRQIQTPISPAQPSPISSGGITAIQPPATATMNPISDSHNMMGQVVTGVIDGVFDAGYLLSVRVGPNNTLLRGLVFQQGHFCPITPANDVTPHLKMLRRESFQVPNTNQTQLCTKPPPQLGLPVPMQNYQTTPMVVAGGSSNSAHPPPPENLRMVEQDEIMQVFEVSKLVEEPSKVDHNDGCGDQGPKKDHLVSDSDLMAESLPRNEGVKNPSLHCGAPLAQDIEHIDEADIKKQEGESLEVATQVDTRIEDQATFEKDALQHECDKQQVGEASKIDVNEDPNQAIMSNLFQTN